MVLIGIKCNSGEKWIDCAFNAAKGIAEVQATKKVLIVDTGKEMASWRGLQDVVMEKYDYKNYKKALMTGGKIVLVHEKSPSGVSDIGIARLLENAGVVASEDVYVIFKDER